MRQTFNPQEIQQFRFDGFYFDERSTSVQLRYSLDDHYTFTETIRFPLPPARLSTGQRHALDNALSLLHLFAGISYYKAAIPPNITFAGAPPDKLTARLVETLYRHGLGEFAFRNGLQLHDRIHFPASDDPADGAVALRPDKGLLVPVGGGKDSIVSLEAMKRSDDAVTLFSVGEAAPIRLTAARSGLPWLSAQRQLSPELFALNKLGALNGHVPVTAIVSMIAICTAIMHGHSAVVLSNERSASQGNLKLEDGFVVNHQYSKGLDFEIALAHHVRSHIVSDLDYFSLLRPWSELAIARQFSRHEQYHPIFTSCNSNFTIHRDRPSSRWCLDCPKCRFVFLALAPFVEREKLSGIFGKNLLNDASQKPGYEALLGIDAHKPFECVGEEAECAAAFVLLSKLPDWKDDIIVKYFREQVLPGIDAADKLPAKYLTASPEHNIPDKYLEVVRAHFRS